MVSKSEYDPPSGQALATSATPSTAAAAATTGKAVCLARPLRMRKHGRRKIYFFGSLFDKFVILFSVPRFTQGQTERKKIGTEYCDCLWATTPPSGRKTIQGIVTVIACGLLSGWW